MAHAFYIVGAKEEGSERARAHLQTLGVTEIDIFSYGLFSVEEARMILERGYRTSRTGSTQGIIIAVDRIFHEAQNALLKLFEEPPQGMYLALVVPSTGVLLDTLRSRLTHIHTGTAQVYTKAKEFLLANKNERSAYIEKVVARSKSDKQSEKDSARSDVRVLVEELLGYTYGIYEKKPSPALQSLLSDFDTFIPILNERSAPLKLILEHISLVIPPELERA